MLAWWLLLIAFIVAGIIGIFLMAILALSR